MTKATTKARLGISYARVSTREQGEENFSVQTQHEANHRYAQQHGIQIVEDITDTMSGAVFERPGMARAQELLANGTANILIAYASDRFSRDLVHSALLRQAMWKVGAELHYSTRGMVKPNPDDEMVENMMAVFAQRERSVFRERVMRGAKAKVDSGQIPGDGRAPFGYRYVQDGPKLGRYEIVEEEAQIVRLIYDLYMEGVGVHKIILRLREQQIPRPVDMRSHNRTKQGYAQWTRGSVYKLLHSPVYGGVFYANQRQIDPIRGRRYTIVTPKSQWQPLAVPPIINPEIWETVQKKLEVGRQLAARNSKHFYLIGRRVKCGCCGHTMTGVSNGNGGNNLWYRCNYRYERGLPTQCTLPQFKASDVEYTVWSWLEALLKDDDALHQGLAELDAEREQRHATLAERRAVLTAQRQQVDEQLRRLLDLYLAGGFDRQVLNERKADLEEAKERLDEELRDLDEVPIPKLTPDQTAALFAHIATIRSQLDSATEVTKRYFIDLFDVQVTLYLADDVRMCRIKCAFTVEPVCLPISIVSPSTFAFLPPLR